MRQRPIMVRISSEIVTLNTAGKSVTDVEITTPVASDLLQELEFHGSLKSLKMFAGYPCKVIESLQRKVIIRYAVKGLDSVTKAVTVPL